MHFEKNEKIIEKQTKRKTENEIKKNCRAKKENNKIVSSISLLLSFFALFNL